MLYMWIVEFDVVISIPCFGVIYLLFSIICLCLCVGMSFSCNRQHSAADGGLQSLQCRGTETLFSGSSIVACDARLQRQSAVILAPRAAMPCTLVFFTSPRPELRLQILRLQCNRFCIHLSYMKEQKIISYHELWHVLIRVKLNSSKSLLTPLGGLLHGQRHRLLPLLGFLC